MTSGLTYRLGSTAGADEIISPDGTRMVYVSQGRLFTRRLDQPNATELAGTQGALCSFLLPGRAVGCFLHCGKAAKDFGGGRLGNHIVQRGQCARGGSWGEDGNIIAALTITGGLSRIPSAGGPPTPVTDLQTGEITHRWPQILPGGKAVLFTASPANGVRRGQHRSDVFGGSPQENPGARRHIWPLFAPVGHLVYVNRGTLFAVPFDVDRLEVHGTPAPVLDQVGYNAAMGSAQLDFSQTGTLIYRSGGARRRTAHCCVA